MRTRDKAIYPVILLFGPTAVGKTDLLYSLNFKRFEVINADSMQVYRFMNIGTAKPAPELRSAVTHHLIDILDPKEQYNAGLFVRFADELVPDILSRGKIPVLSGGTAFYFRNFMYGLPETPPVDEEIRKAVKRDFTEFGAEELYRQLRKIDPVSYHRLSENDVYRVTRVHEVYRQTGKPLSEYRKGTELRKEYDFYTFGLQRPRDELYARINERVRSMFLRGLPGEIADLIDGGYVESDPGMSAIGYREFFVMRREGCKTLGDTMELIQRDSRRYAKRQITFFTRLPGVSWIHPEEKEGVRSCLDALYSRIS